MAGDNPHTRERSSRVTYSGFCVGGIDRPHPELADIADTRERLNVLRRIAKDEAQLVYELGGNLLRLFYSMNTLCALETEDVGLAFPRSLHASPGFGRASGEERLDRLDRIEGLLSE